VIEVSCLDVISTTTRGGTIDKMVLTWNKAAKKYEPVRKLPLVALISPNFVRRREDKTIRPEDLRLQQVTDLVEVPLADRDARSLTLPASEVVRREVWTKVMRGQTMVRKLLLWKTNKDRDSADHPAYVLHHTDFSPNREEPLQREVRIGRTLEEMERHWEKLEKEKILKGWYRAKER
jgi:hypothetical protein